MFSKCLKKVLVRNVRFYSDKKVGILGIPFDQGQTKKGVDSAPTAIRNYGLINKLKTIENLDIRDYGDISYKPETVSLKPVPNMKNLDHVAACTKEVSKAVNEIITSGRTAISLGGDHACSIGTVDGHIQAKGSNNVAVIWVDAHGDLNTNYTSDTGNVHGMPVAILVKELADYWPYLPGMDWQTPLMPVRNIAYIGLRSVDKYERFIIEKFGIPAFGMEDIERLGINVVMQMVMAKIDPYNNKSLHVSFDIDSLDSLEAPSTGTSVRGGLTLREGVSLMEAFYRTGRLNGIDLVEVNPDIGDKKDVKTTIDAAISILMAGCGHFRSGILPKVEDLPKPK
ncbi:arginase, hepatic [Chrysoperla carnea]|uniref:arginase, hepatic n=1 Tax=Chrysoperla carnea TaxID=189513 RepID=UPI001D0786DD|nr:arginase, hepatic [Chrysoperla carnea]